MPRLRPRIQGRRGFGTYEMPEFVRDAGPDTSVRVAPEFWWGANRDGQWNLKTGIVWYRGVTTGE